MKHKKTLLILAGNLIALFIILQEVKAQDPQGYIYGRVSTYNNQYEGRLRWGKEEAFWNDYFNASKTRSNKFETYRKRGNEQRTSGTWTDIDWNFKSIWEDKGGTVHQFSCQFGDIKAITDLNGHFLTLVMKNGERILLDGNGYNDIGTQVVVMDRELGKVILTWDKIRKIEFMPTPQTLNVSSAPPIYGSVETFRKGSFTGFIQWDHDERLGDDRLDGSTADSKVSLPFREIKSIHKERNGANVVLHSGRTFYLTSSNDVNSENRGVIVTVPELGKIDIPWKYFESISFEKAPDSGPTYTSYSSPRGLSGQVYTVEGEELKGRIIYDLDEIWEIECLEGNDDDVKYVIAFRDIKRIEPKNYHYSKITLRNGESLLLGEGRDVSDRNDGLLVYSRGKAEPSHIPWNKVVEIVFE